MRNAMTLVGPYCQPLHVQSSPDSSWLLTMLTTPDDGGHSERTKAENDGKASDGNKQQPWKIGSVVAGGGEYEGNNMQVKHTNGTKSPRINCSSNF